MTQNAAARRRNAPDLIYDGWFRARLGAFERAASAASSGGGGFAGIGQNRRWRRAEVAAFSGARRARCLGVTGRRVGVRVGLLGTPGAQR